ncbi:hypothetical protein GCK32_022832, partial [Trichostrongylus colubriformis]
MERPKKTGPVLYATSEGANPMERDGIRGGIVTKVVRDFDNLAKVLEEWRTSKAWVIVWPQEANFRDDTMERAIKTAKAYLEEGGLIATAWPPITAKNQSKWPNMSDGWKTFDEALLKLDRYDRVFCTASNRIMDGRLFLEEGAPEGSAQFYSNYVGTALPKQVY